MLIKLPKAVREKYDLYVDPRRVAAVGPSFKENAIEPSGTILLVDTREIPIDWEVEDVMEVLGLKGR